VPPGSVRLATVAPEADVSSGWLGGRRLQRSRQKATAGRDSLRARMHFFLHLAPDAKWGRTWDSFQALLAMLSCTIYVVNTYAPADECTLMPEQAGLVVELVTSALFTSDYVLQLFLAKRRIRHVLSLVALAELLTVHLPPARPRRGGPDLGGRDRGLLVELCVRPLPPPHALPAYRPPRPFLPQPAQDSDSFTHHATMLGLYIFTIVLVAACMLQSSAVHACPSRRPRAMLSLL